MSAREEALEQHVPGTTKLFVWVWVALLIMTGLETLLAYEDMALLIMLTLLMGLSVIKTGYILSYFMHLRFERMGLFLMIVPSAVFLVCMILLFLYPDSIRLMHMQAR
ncbi:MAG: cytochrome C oxidase subunit IV family protein [Acidobacteriota bacterium]|nr:cytochrome C oxidase subunit IV family protein [Acidobacteriota bacterium]